MFPATSSAGSSYIRTLLSKNEEIECAAYLQSSARSFKRLAPGYSTLGQQLTADDAAATVTLCLVFHDEVFRCSVCPRCNCLSVVCFVLGVIVCPWNVVFVCPIASRFLNLEQAIIFFESSTS
jgi:hypothetical protein